MNRLVNLFRVVALLLAAVAAGCATGPAGAPSSAQVEALLLQAGFKTVPARSEQQLTYLPQLPAGQVTVLTQFNRQWYVYPDLPQKRVYVGTLKQYEAYLALRQQANLPMPDPYAAVAAAGRRDDRRFQALRRRPRQLVAGVR